MGTGVRSDALSKHSPKPAAVRPTIRLRSSLQSERTSAPGLLNLLVRLPPIEAASVVTYSIHPSCFGSRCSLQDPPRNFHRSWASCMANASEFTRSTACAQLQRLLISWRRWAIRVYFAEHRTLNCFSSKYCASLIYAESEAADVSLICRERYPFGQGGSLHHVLEPGRSLTFGRWVLSRNWR